MIRISKRMLVYGALILGLTLIMLALVQSGAETIGIISLIGWALGYTVFTWLFLRGDDQARTRGNLKLSYGLVGLIATLPAVAIVDVLTSPASQNPLLEKLWLLPSLLLIVVFNVALQRTRLKGFRKQEVFK